MRDRTRHIKGILDGLLGKWEKGTVKKGDAVRAAWAATAEEEARKHARPVNMKNGILMVIVESSSWLYKFTLEKKDILERFNENYKGRKKATDIRFRIGTLDT
ncbi:MAG: hypothetical protein DRP85_03880 [Candidatus Makaraimicrobium thalassicum]|nr:MAG: hypothetical protein DRP85_03880 [Candidatus Omnitrophota bacterium]